MCASVTRSCLTLCDPMDCITPQTPLSTGFSRQENWSGLPFPSPVDLPDHGIKAGSPALQADSLPSEPPGKPRHPVHAKLPVVSLCDPVGCSLPGPNVHGGFSRQEYWSGLSFPSPGGLPHPGTEAGWVFCIGKQILYHLSHQGSPSSPVVIWSYFISRLLYVRAIFPSAWKWDAGLIHSEGAGGAARRCIAVRQ